MAISWYYVENNERVGPISEETLEELVRNGNLGEDSFVWKKGFDDWKKIKDVSELTYCFHLGSPTESEEDETPSMPEIVPEEASTESPEEEKIDWDSIPSDQNIFSIKVGLDRNGGEEAEYGPFSLDVLKKLYEEHRINEKTLIFMPGMINWTFLADLPIYRRLTSNLPPVIDEKDRRVSIRKPFVAKMIFHDNSKVYEGVCRDISVGGLQILVSDFPGRAGDEITINVHPDNSEYSFVATGKIVRTLGGNKGFSVRFLQLSEEAQSAINSYLDQS